MKHKTKKLELKENEKKRTINQPPTPHFTGISKINVDVPEDADVNFFCWFVYNGEIDWYDCFSNKFICRTISIEKSEPVKKFKGW